MRYALGLLVMAVVAGCGSPSSPPPSSTPFSSPSRLPPSQAAERQATWDERVVWPNGDSLLVSAPRHPDRNGVPEQEWTELSVILTNAGKEPRRALDHAFDAEANGRLIHPIIQDVDGADLTRHTIGPGQSFTYTIAFVTSMLGGRAAHPALEEQQLQDLAERDDQREDGGSVSERRGAIRPDS